jgi:O-antigen ligase
LHPDTTPDGAASKVRIAAACALLIASVAWPPEIHPWSRAFCHGIAAALGLTLLSPGAFFRAPRLRWSVVLLPLAFASILSAACRSRAVDEGLDAGLLIVAGLLGRRLGADAGARRGIAIVLTVLGTAVSAHAILQHFVTYPRWAESLAAAGTGTSPDLIVFLKEGRPAGPFSLPSALGGFLALCLPQALALTLAPARRRAGRLAALAAGVLEIAALVLSRSIGSVAALAAGILLTLPRRRPGRRAMAGAVVGLLAAAGIGYFLMARGLESAAAQGLDPLSLRIGNWRAAASMVRDHPLFGVGPGSFATFYGRYMGEGMNETRFAHNSYLQAIAVWGIWVIFPIALMLQAVVGSLRAAPSAEEPFAIAALGGAYAFLVHNLGDFTAYLPGVALSGAILIGLSMPAPEPHSGPSCRAGALPRRGVKVAFAGAIALLWVTHVCCFARALSLREAALQAADRGDIGEAVASLRAAERLRPRDPDPRAFLAQMILAKGMNDTALRSEGSRAIDRALALDPESANLHYTRALYHQAAGETAAAYREIRAAHELYPIKATYRSGAPAGQAGRP